MSTVKKLFIFDLDQTLVDSNVVLELRVKKKWSEVYKMISEISLYPNIKEIFELIKKSGHQIAIVTSSPKKYCEKILKYHDLEIKNVVGYHDTKNKKPHPEPILKAIINSGINKENVVSFGDNINDIIASNKANVVSVGCAWGLSDKTYDFKNEANQILSNTLELYYFIRRHYIDFGDPIFEKRRLNFGDKKYVGECKNFKPHGYGSMFFNNGNKYEGEFKDGYECGVGTYTYACGDQYKGEFEYNLEWGSYQHGQGTYTHANGDQYKGEWKEALPSGIGVHTWANGDKYEGEWKFGSKHGQGTYTYTNGEKYEGKWEDDLKHGQGTQIYKSGAKYEGEWKDGVRHGKGVCIWPDGREYHGEWKNNKRHGIGIAIKDGDKYEGEFKDDKMNGKGTFSGSNGSKYEGKLKDNKPHLKGKFKYSNGNSYEGDFYNGQWHGQGIFTYSNGDKYEGNFYKGKKHGQGTYTYANGEKYEGDYKDGKRHGYGIYIGLLGEKYSGGWKDGHRHGFGTNILDNGEKYEGGWVKGKEEGRGVWSTASGVRYEADWKEGKNITGLIPIDLDNNQKQLSNHFINNQIDLGLLESTFSFFYIPKRYLDDIIDKASNNLLLFKDGNMKSIMIWKKIALQHFENKSYNYVVRALSSHEIKAREINPLDYIAEAVANFTGAKYVKNILSKIKLTEPLKNMSKKERKNEISGVYQVSSNLDLLNKKVLVIDDVTTTGATIKELARALKKQYSSVKISSYCLCKTSEDLFVSTAHNNLFDDFL